MSEIIKTTGDVGQPLELEKIMVDLASGMPPGNFYCQLIVRALLRLDKWPEELQMEKSVLSILTNYEFSARSKIEIILRVNKLGVDRRNAILLSLVNNSVSERNSDVCRKLAFICLLKTISIDFKTSNDEIYQLLGVENFDFDYALDFLRTLGQNLYDQSKVFQLFQSVYANEYVKEMGEHVHKLKAKDTTGRWAYYFVLVEPEMENEYLRACARDGTLDLEDYGKVVASCYGEVPSTEVKTYLKERYDFDV
ncbi:MAG: hypothetical protein ABIN80_05675 [Dyadobacter sp.]|uniref:hypothetical protein n=1 Tax=Dyadobacter sp. TaxID=1914288 RepID=UPI003264A186